MKPVTTVEVGSKAVAADAAENRFFIFFGYNKLAYQPGP
jgi:hypothetical protein